MPFGMVEIAHATAFRAGFAAHGFVSSGRIRGHDGEPFRMRKLTGFRDTEIGLNRLPTEVGAQPPLGLRAAIHR
jgi:hypothetical protein